MKNVEEFLKQHGTQLKLSINENREQPQEDFNNIEEFDKAKTKVLKYVLYKKRTQQEVMQKFSSLDKNLLEDIIENLKQNGYIDDENYIERAVKEFMAIKTLSIKEMRNKLCIKGLSNTIIDNYFSKMHEELNDYEIDCAKKIILKKQELLEKEEIEKFLYKKGYSSDNIKIAFERKYKLKM